MENSKPVFNSTQDSGYPKKTLERFQEFKRKNNLQDNDEIVFFWGKNSTYTCKEAEDCIVGNVKQIPKNI